MGKISAIKERLLGSKLFKDSFWAVFGNGMGSFLIMLSGILIARFLGKDLYGEYGVVKTTMIYIASFSTFGLGITSTKYVSQFIAENPSHIKKIIKDSLKITLSFSSFLAVLLIIFADGMANFLNKPSLATPFRVLACIIVCRSLTTTLVAVLGGLKKYKTSAINNLLSGIVLLSLCIPLTYFFSIEGALLALLLSQIFNFVINYRVVKKCMTAFNDDTKKSYTKELITFSFPVALQESSIWVCNWICIMLLTKLSSAGELGLYTAAAQWNAVIALLPTTLSNVVLSYIAGSTKDSMKHNSLVKKMFLINLFSTLLPFLIVYLFADFISSFYGSTFSELKMVLRILTFNAILESCAYVFKAEFITANKAWTFFGLRFVRDIIMTLSSYVVLCRTGGENGAIMFSTIIVITSGLYLLIMLAIYRNKIYNTLA